MRYMIMHYASQADIDAMAGKETVADPAWTPEEVRAVGRAGVVLGETRHRVSAVDRHPELTLRPVSWRFSASASPFQPTTATVPGSPATTYALRDSRLPDGTAAQQRYGAPWHSRSERVDRHAS